MISNHKYIITTNHSATVGSHSLLKIYCLQYTNNQRPDSQYHRMVYEYVYILSYKIYLVKVLLKKIHTLANLLVHQAYSS